MPVWDSWDWDELMVSSNSHCSHTRVYITVDRWSWFRAVSLTLYLHTVSRHMELYLIVNTIFKSICCFCSVTYWPITLLRTEASPDFPFMSIDFRLRVLSVMQMHKLACELLMQTTFLMKWLTTVFLYSSVLNVAFCCAYHQLKVDFYIWI